MRVQIMILQFKGLRLRLLKHFAVTIFSANQLDYFFLFQPQKIVVYLHRKKGLMTRERPLH